MHGWVMLPCSLKSLSFEVIAHEEYSVLGLVKCPSCSVKINDIEIQNTIGEEAFNKIQKDYVLSAIQSDSNIIMCDWGNAIDFMKGKPDYKQKDDNGNISNILHYFSYLLF